VTVHELGQGSVTMEYKGKQHYTSVFLLAKQFVLIWATGLYLDTSYYPKPVLVVLTDLDHCNITVNRPLNIQPTLASHSSIQLIAIGRTILIDDGEMVQHSVAKWTTVRVRANMRDQYCMNGSWHCQGVDHGQDCDHDSDCEHGQNHGS